MDPIVNNLERMIDSFYSSDYNSNNQKESFNEVNQILTNAQYSNEAWTFVWSLLQKEKSMNVQSFGAGTLYAKISKNFFELDLNSQLEIRKRIVEYLISFLDNPEFSFVTTKLISCLAAYVIQTIDSSWPTALADIANLIQPEKLSHLPPTRVVNVLLQILYSITEEFNKIHIDKFKKVAIRNELQKHAQWVLFIVHKVVSEDNISDTITKISVKCFSNWTVGLGTLNLSEHHSSIITIMLNAACNESTCENAVESIIEIYTSPHIEKYPKLILELVEQMTTGLESVVIKAASESKLDFCKNLYILFIYIGESNCRLLLDSLIDMPEYTKSIVKMLQIILRCSSTPGYFGYDEFISDQPFNFWITFQDDIMGSDENKIHTYLLLFKEIYESLINCFLVKVQYPPDEIMINEWDEDDHERFRCYRQDIGDTFMYCFNIFRSSMLKILFTHFTKAIDQISVVSDKQLIATARFLEATLFAFSSIAENIDVAESTYLPQIFSSFSTIPFDKINSPQLLETIMNLFASFAEWLCCNVNYIPFTISAISTALKSNSPLVVVSATMALKVITPECQPNLLPYATQLILLCEEHLSYSTLKYKDKARLMFTLGTVLSIMPMEVIMQTIDRILVPILSETEQVLCITENDNKVREHIIGVLLMLANLFSKLDVNLKGTDIEEGDEMVSKSKMIKSAKNNIKPQPLYIIFEKVLPLFGAIATKYSNDENITENLCECIKKSVITLLDDVRPLVGTILQLLLHLYRASKSIYVLKISRQLFTLFHSSAEHLPHLQEYFMAIIQITIDSFQVDFRENTYLIQVFFEEFAAILKKSPVICAHSKLDMAPIYNFAISGIVLPEKPTIHQCAVFITEFLNHGQYASEDIKTNNFKSSKLFWSKQKFSFKIIMLAVENKSQCDINRFTNRTHTCGQIDDHLIGQEVNLCGWIEYQRLGKFVVLKDCYGIVQLFIKNKNLQEIVKKLSFESVIQVRGKVNSRPEKDINTNMKNGNVEIVVNELEVLNHAKPDLPFLSREHAQVTEKVRLEYRYLDLRQTKMSQNLRIRSKLIMSLRNCLVDKFGFIEVETPTLFKATPGGAQEFIVPTRFPNQFYSLVQSPQQFKQLLMVGGIDRYFQVARCYRDEGTKPNRQPEFTQLDIELSFTSIDKVIDLIENLLCQCWPIETERLQLVKPFARLNYYTAMELYGSDKPDMRSDIKIQQFKNEDVSYYYLVIPQDYDQHFSIRQFIEEGLSVQMNTLNFKGNLNHFKWSSLPFQHNLDHTILDHLTQCSLKDNDYIWLTSGDKANCLRLLGRIRASCIDLIENDLVLKSKLPRKLSILWIDDFPLFLPNEETNQLESSHHPFTAPKPSQSDLVYTDPSKVIGQNFDLVINGHEIGGGSIRIVDHELQRYILQDILKCNASSLFYFMEALNSGCPPHGGFAIGLDRLMALVCQEMSIRDVIAFPKAAHGKDLMANSPAPVEEHVQQIYHISPR
ncbi:hypothetical protein RDWZM_002671 [Blomia tropicalis]|uniref:Importin-13 n=1 Tax=Blomia tropicalis TaxID=40697 RepID=A0A9Q0RSE2_BLOTA|nr:hypothetical protein RDWZM_002671 [Blomia tropicalis]